MPTSKAVRVDEGSVAASFRGELKQKIEKHVSNNHKRPKLVGFLATNDPGAKSYANATGKTCESDGIIYELREVSKDELEQRILDANEDPNIHGIIVYYPIFGSVDNPEMNEYVNCTMDDYIRNTVALEKDVEGLCFVYKNNLYRNVRYLDREKTKKSILPCTALSIVMNLHSVGCYDMSHKVGERLSGKVVTVINRSDIVGRPLVAMLANDGAIVYSIDINSTYRVTRGKYWPCQDDLKSIISKSDIVISGVPSKQYRLPVDSIKPGSVVVSFARWRNVNVKKLMKIEGVVYVPSVGKMTVAMLERNVVRLYEQYSDHKIKAKL